MKYLIALLLLCFVSCGLINEGVVLKETSPFSELNKTTSIPIEGILNQRYTIELPSRPSTGYLWSLHPHDSAVMKYMQNSTFGTSERNQCQDIQSVSWQKFSFEAIATGKSQIRFWNRRTWENSTVPMIYEVRMNIVNPC